MDVDADVVLDRYVKCLYVYNKVDMISIEDMDKLAREPNSIVVSVHMKLNLDALLVRREVELRGTEWRIWLASLCPGRVV